MPAVKFTAETLKEMNAPTDSGQLEYHWDTVVSGFGLRCAANTTRRSWIAWGDVVRDGRKTRTRTITFADFDAMSLRDARNKARDILAGMSIGIDPKEVPPEQLDKTLRAALDDLLNAVPQNMTGRNKDEPTTS